MSKLTKTQINHILNRVCARYNRADLQRAIEAKYPLPKESAAVKAYRKKLNDVLQCSRAHSSVYDNSDTMLLIAVAEVGLPSAAVINYFKRKGKVKAKRAEVRERIHREFHAHKDALEDDLVMNGDASSLQEALEAIDKILKV
ncbi:MAG TPA: hypothetical protein VKP88_00475 [Candidatus Paceibacterota bacterium]|nr:hypothetical protein [Candidatus Paceibacterota bacterium]